MLMELHMHQGIQRGGTKLSVCIVSRMHEDLAIEASVDELDKMEAKFTAIVKERVSADPELK